MTWESALSEAKSFSNNSFIVSIPEDALILEKMIEQKRVEMKAFVSLWLNCKPQQQGSSILKKKTHFPNWLLSLSIVKN